MTFELTVLGSSSALPTSTKYPAAHVLNVHERFFLIDCGEGTQIQLRKAKIRFSRIHHIFISHMHGDHVFGLLGLFSTFDLLGRKVPLHVYGPPELCNLIDFYRQYFGAGSLYTIEIHPLHKRTDQKIYEDKIVEIHAFPLKHRITTFGFLFREKNRPLNIKKDKITEFNLNFEQIITAKTGNDIRMGNGRLIPNALVTELQNKSRSFAYCSDTAFYEKNIDILKDVDLLYHEATFMDTDKKLAKQTGHSTARQAATMAKLSNAKQLLIGHFSNRYKDPLSILAEASDIFADTLMAEELKKYPVELKRDSARR
jgi:ribonuclease Z